MKNGNSVIRFLCVQIANGRRRIEQDATEENEECVGCRSEQIAALLKVDFLLQNSFVLRRL
jgi:hypothetical protein